MKMGVQRNLFKMPSEVLQTKSDLFQTNSDLIQIKSDLVFTISHIIFSHHKFEFRSTRFCTSQKQVLSFQFVLSLPNPRHREE